MSKSRPSVLVIAESCNPEWVSVPLVGWFHARALREVADVHLVTQIRNRDAISRTGLIEGEDFTAIDSERVARPVWKMANFFRGDSGKGWTTATAVSALSYYYFERLVWRRFADDLAAKRFDLVHRVTPLSPTQPSTIAPKCARLGVPFVLGPLNGGLPWPRGFDDVRRQEREWLSYLRRAYKLLPGLKRTYRVASATIVASRATLDQLPASAHDRAIYIAENGVAPERFTVKRTRKAQRPLKLLFLSRLVPYKGADMLIDAAAPLLQSGDIQLEIAGEGPQRDQLTQKLRALNLESESILTGWVQHEDVQRKLIKADVFALPSIREFGGGAALEAMAVGVPPIVIDYGGPADLVTERTGWLVPLGSRAQIIERLRQTLVHIATRPDVVDEKGAAALRRAHTQFSWNTKAQQTLQVYEWVLGRRSDKPSFPLPTPDIEPSQVAPEPASAAT